MSEEELRQVIAETKALKEAQERPDSPEALAAIPCLSLDDLERENKIIPLEVSQLASSKILYHDFFTNDIAYLDVGMNLHLLPQDLLPYISLFGRSLLGMGTEQEDFVKLSQQIDRKTGGISPSILNSVVKNCEQGASWLFLRGKAMVPQVGDLLAILGDVLLTVQLDNPERFLQIVLKNKAQMEASLLPRGHVVVNRRISAHFNVADWVGEQMGGISQLFFLRQLAVDIQSDWPSVLAKLEQIRETLVNRNAMLCNVTLDQANWQRVQPQLADFLSRLPTAPINTVAWTPTTSPAFEGLTIPARVNYVGKATALYKHGYKLHGSAIVISRYLRTSWLWEKVRVQGGAYGGFSLFDSMAGTFSFLSYRDPNLLDTLDVYDRSSHFLRTEELSQEELSKGIIGAIGDWDSYQLPDAKGFTSMKRHLIGRSDEERQKLREEILSTTLNDFRAFADTLDQVKEHGHIVVMGESSNLERANQELEKERQLVITKVL
jgi:Zn-dependent M16 (insulinase) family peptidase